MLTSILYFTILLLGLENKASNKHILILKYSAVTTHPLHMDTRGTHLNKLRIEMQHVMAKQKHETTEPQLQVCCIYMYAHEIRQFPL